MKKKYSKCVHVSDFLNKYENKNDEKRKFIKLEKKHVIISHSHTHTHTHHSLDWLNDLCEC